jgi:hypothetical protein
MSHAPLVTLPSDSVACREWPQGTSAGAVVLSLPKPRMSPERPFEFLGHPSWPKEAALWAAVHCLRPQAEFARPSGRGPRRVKKFVQATKGICKKKFNSSEKEKSTHSKRRRPIIINLHFTCAGDAVRARFSKGLLPYEQDFGKHLSSDRSLLHGFPSTI